MKAFYAFVVKLEGGAIRCISICRMKRISSGKCLILYRMSTVMGLFWIISSFLSCVASLAGLMFILLSIL